MGLEYWQKKIQDKRKQTLWREFVMEICSWYQVGLYKNNGVISRFPESKRSGPIFPVDQYRSEYIDMPGFVDFDINSSFFDQFARFFSQIPKMALLHYGNNENVFYADTIYGAKNAYISISVGDTSENVLYSNMVFDNCINVLDSAVVSNYSENIFCTMVAVHSQDIFYSRYIYNSHNIRFSDNLLGCAECLFCSHLENQTYCIYNKSYSPEEYFSEKEKILNQKNMFWDYYQKVNHAAENKGSLSCDGQGISFSELVDNGYYISRMQNGRNIFCGDGSPLATYIYDVMDASKVDHAYAWMGVGQNAEHMYCGSNASTCYNVYYSYFMDTCSFCLGCVGLKNKSYCILNKQYTKEERHEKVEEIFRRMEEEGTLGQFFPPNMNPFYFNDTAAYLIDPSFTKEEVTKLGYLRRDEAIKVDIPAGAEVVKVSELSNFEGFVIAREGNDRCNPGGIQWIASSSLHSFSQGRDEVRRHIDPSILDKIIVDEQGNYYRIVKMEYDFLLKYGLPLPRKHRLDRMKENFRLQS